VITSPSDCKCRLPSRRVLAGLILESRLRGVLRAELFDVDVTVDRDGDEQVWTREQWQDTKEVVVDEWSTRGYYRELDLPPAVDAAHATATYGNGVLSYRSLWRKQ
jgi:hypothetical protein